MPPQIRLEIYIPTFYNPDKNGDRKSIELRKHRLVKNQIVDKFKAVSIHPLTVQGIWVDPETNKRHFDNCYRFEVCINPREDVGTYLEEWKKELEDLFEQFEIYMIYYEVNKV